MQHSNRAVIFEFIGNRKRSHIFKRRFSISLYADATEMYSSDYNKHYLRPCHSTSASAAINRRLFVVDDVLESVAATPRSVATALVAPSGLLRYLYAARGFVDLPTTAETLQPPESPCPFKLTSRFRVNDNLNGGGVSGRRLVFVVVATKSQMVLDAFRWSRAQCQINGDAQVCD